MNTLARYQIDIFLSTPSVRRATWLSCPVTAKNKKFLSTPSARRVTGRGRHAAARTGHFYPRPPRGGRHSEPDTRASANSISIHALREEGDHQIPDRPRGAIDFYPRPPRGGRPPQNRQHPERHRISIHALREEGDQSYWTASISSTRFLSTPSARRVTYEQRRLQPLVTYFYPRPPRGG